MFNVSHSKNIMQVKLFFMIHIRSPTPAID